ncbi:MAG TPA: hypothetical protein PKI20_03105 [Verrucomicrobiota bacterium]|nr:hypothetical protein [Verrucomicrobiota bacterium]HQL76726.1 hypothetical protein [Verrucomicrobiota bacterium]
MRFWFKQFAPLAVALAGARFCLAEGQAPMTAPEAAFAIYTVAEPVDRRLLARGSGECSKIALSPAPVISNADILNYDLATHTLRLAPEARARLPRPPVPGTPFVVTAEGKPIYLGVFVTSVSSMSFAVPSIVLDARFRTNQGPNALVIDRAYPAADFGVGPDPRGDPRIRRALEKRVSLAREVPADESLAALRAILPQDWTLRHYLDAQPYGFEASFIRGAGFTFTGPSRVKGPKGELTQEGFKLVLMPEEFLGHPRLPTATDPGPAASPSRFLGWTTERTVWRKVYCDSRTETPTWPGWEPAVKRAVGIPLHPVSICMSTHSQSLTVTTNYVVLVTRVDGRKAAVQFTRFGVKTATYRWRCRAADSQTVQTGTGEVYEKEPYDESPEALALPRHDCNVRAGDVRLAWSCGGTSQGYLYFYPSRERVRIQAAEAFERLP